MKTTKKMIFQLAKAAGFTCGYNGKEKKFYLEAVFEPTEKNFDIIAALKSAIADFGATMQHETIVC
jgi:hypothetical protein